MKQNKYLLLAATVLLITFTGCKNQDPFETQSADDTPRILYPFNESGTNGYNYYLADPETPFPDSVIVTPSDYTTVRWYVDGQLMHEGLRMENTFMAGHYEMKVVASTEKAETFRTGTITVQPFELDPYSEADGFDRHVVPATEATFAGANLDKVQSIHLYTKYNEEQVAEVSTFTATEGSITFLVPELVSGTYHMVFESTEGSLCGANKLYIHEEPVVLAGFDCFTIGKEWILTGMGLDKVTAIQIGATTITDFTVTESEIKLVGPQMDEGDYTLIIWAGDKQATYINKKGEMCSEVTITCQAKAIILICEDVNVGCNGDPDWTAKRIDNEFDWSKVAVGTVIYVEAHRDAATTDYNNFQIMTPDWGFRYPDAEHNLEFDGENSKVFEITVTAEMLAAFIEKGMGTAGHGTVIDRIYYEAPDETELWTGPVNIDWNENLVRIEAAQMASVRVGATILVYWEIDPTPGYTAFRITTPWWGEDDDLLANFVCRINDASTMSSPFEFEWDDRCKALIEERGAMSILGAGFTINKITWK